MAGLMIVCVIIYAVWSTEASGLGGTFERIAFLIPLIWTFTCGDVCRPEPSHYEEEAADLLPTLRAAPDAPPSMLLELGCGGGNRPSPQARAAPDADRPVGADAPRRAASAWRRGRTDLPL